MVSQQCLALRKPLVSMFGREREDTNHQESKLYRALEHPGHAAPVCLSGIFEFCSIRD